MSATTHRLPLGKLGKNGDPWTAAFRAIALNAARRPGKSGRLIAGKSLFDRKGIVAVLGCRSLPRHVGTCRCLVSLVVVAHALMIARQKIERPSYPHSGRASMLLLNERYVEFIRSACCKLERPS